MKLSVAMLLVGMLHSLCFAGLPDIFTNGAGTVMYQKSTGQIVAPGRTAFIASNDLATVTAVNSSNAVQDAAIGTKASTNETAALGITNAAQDVAIALRATIAQLAATSAADRVYANGLTDPNALTNGVGSGCTVTSTGKTFYVYVVAPTGTAASVDSDLQDHKTNATAHAALLTSLTNGLTPDDTTWRASTQTWNTVTNKADTATLGGYVQTNNPALTDNRTDGAAWHYGDSVTGAVDSVARGLTNYDAYGSSLAVSNAFTNAAALAVTALQSEADTLSTVLVRGNSATNLSTLYVSMFIPERRYGLGDGESGGIGFIAESGTRNTNRLIGVWDNAVTSGGYFSRRGNNNFIFKIYDEETFIAGVDYLSPNGSGSNLTGITAAQVGASPTGHVHDATAITNAPWLTSSSTASNSDLLDGQHGSYYIGLTNSLASTGYVATATAGMVTGTPWASAGYLTNLMGAMTNLVLTTNAPSGTTFSNGTLNLGTNAASSGGSSYGFLNTNANAGVYTSGTNVWIGTNSPWIFGTGRVWLTDSGGTSTLYHITSGNVTNLIGSFTGL